MPKQLQFLRSPIFWLALLIAGLVVSWASTGRFGGSTSQAQEQMETTPEDGSVSYSRPYTSNLAANPGVGSAALAPIDAMQPASFETASFALG